MDLRGSQRAELADDLQTSRIAAVEIPPAAAISARWTKIGGSTTVSPTMGVANGGFSELKAIDELGERDAQPAVRVLRSHRLDLDALVPKPTDFGRTTPTHGGNKHVAEQVELDDRFWTWLVANGWKRAPRFRPDFLVELGHKCASSCGISRASFKTSYASEIVAKFEASTHEFSARVDR